MRSVVLSLVLLLSGLAVASEKEVVLNYDVFFDRMDDLNEPEYVDIKLAFYFNELGKAKACPILDAKIKTKLDEMQVYYLDTGEVLLPFDEKLDQNKAKLIIVTQDGVDCGLNMRLEASFLVSQTVEKEKALGLVKTFDAGLKELSGMMSFLTPDVTGLTFLVKEGAELQLMSNEIGKCKDNRCTLTAEEISTATLPLAFSSTPEKIVPYIQK